MHTGVIRVPKIVSPPGQLRRDAACLAVLVAMRIGLSTVGYAAIRERIPPATPAPEAHFYARQLARRIERLARFVPRASCLTQALTLQYLMARAGHACEIFVGVRCGEGGRFEAHAWVACNGRIVLGAANTNLAEFTPLAERR
jgi:hypothetical protein